jgi:hypothetical protein
MLVFLVEDISYSQYAYVDAIRGYLNEVTSYFEILIIGLSILLMIMVFSIVILILYVTILYPINQLTEHILGTNKDKKKK